MSWIFKRFRVVISIALILSIIIAYFVIYVPMYEKLKLDALSCFLSDARSGERALADFIRDSKRSAALLSGNAELQDHLVDYRVGRIDSSRLREKTQHLFLFGSGLLGGVKGAFRFTNGMQVASFGTGDSSKLTPKGGVDSLRILVDTDKFELIVYSPIVSNKVNLGYDVLFFDFKEIWASINDDRTIFSLVRSDASDPADQSGLSTIKINDFTLYDDGKYILYTSKLEGTELSVSAKELKSKLFEPIIGTSIRNLIYAVICYALLLLLTNLIIIRYVQYRLNQAEKIKEQYKEYAYRDTLTGAYSRLYFEQWLRSRIDKYGIINEDICVVMIDINRYKFINDTYGHAAGDKVLARVSKVLQMSVREEDLVVRYGGDEFLLVLINCKQEQASKILSRISDCLLKLDELNFGLSISYGIEYISSYMDLPQAIHRADEKMYKSKNAYNELLNI